MEIKTYTPTTHKVKALVYGPSGAGKTSFWGSAPKPIFASAEGGLLSIASIKPAYVDIRSTKDLTELYEYLKNKEHPYETVIIDSITEINEIIKAGIEKKNGRGMQLQDWGFLEKEISDILRKFRDLNMHVLFLALEKYEKDGDKIEKIYPLLNGKAQTGIAGFMDIVGYIMVDGSGNRKIITKSNSRTLSKARGVVLEEDDTNFASWVQKCQEIVVWDEVTLYDSEDEARRKKEEDMRKKEEEISKTFEVLKKWLIDADSMDELRSAFLLVERAKKANQITIWYYDELVQIKDEIKRKGYETQPPVAQEEKAPIGSTYSKKYEEFCVLITKTKTLNDLDTLVLEMERSLDNREITKQELELLKSRRGIQLKKLTTNPNSNA